MLGRFYPSSSCVLSHPSVDSVSVMCCICLTHVLDSSQLSVEHRSNSLVAFQHSVQGDCVPGSTWACPVSRKYYLLPAYRVRESTSKTRIKVPELSVTGEQRVSVCQD
jgi:hypothetical protein